jgi:hypothetical protein
MDENYSTNDGMDANSSKYFSRVSPIKKKENVDKENLL